MMNLSSLSTMATARQASKEFNGFSGRYSKQLGVALVSSLIILLLMTVVGLTIIRGNSIFERIAGNTREKQRAFQSAQDALLYAEWWLTQTANYSIVSNPVQCTGVQTTLKVCTSDPSTVKSAISALPFYTNYNPPSMQVASNGRSGGVVTQGDNSSSRGNVGDVIYSAPPGIYINSMPSISGKLTFRVTTVGYGGSGGTYGTQAVIQSIYVLGGNSTSTGTTPNNASLGGQ